MARARKPAEPKTRPVYLVSSITGMTHRAVYPAVSALAFLDALTEHARSIEDRLDNVWIEVDDGAAMIPARAVAIITTTRPK